MQQLTHHRPAGINKLITLITIAAYIAAAHRLGHASGYSLRSVAVASMSPSPPPARTSPPPSRLHHHRFNLDPPHLALGSKSLNLLLGSGQRRAAPAARDDGSVASPAPPSPLAPRCARSIRYRIHLAHRHIGANARWLDRARRWMRAWDRGKKCVIPPRARRRR